MNENLVRLQICFAQNFYLLRKYSEIHAANGERGRIDYQQKSLQKIIYSRLKKFNRVLSNISNYLH